MQAAMGALAIAGPIIKGIGGYKAAQANARALDAAGVDAARAGAAQEADIRAAAARAIGEQSAAQFSNGFLGGTGTAIDTLRESQINAALDALRVRRDASMKLQSYQAEASNQRRQGTFALVEGLIGAGNAAYAQNADWAAAKVGTRAPAPSSAPQATGVLYDPRTQF